MRTSRVVSTRLLAVARFAARPAIVGLGLALLLLASPVAAAERGALFRFEDERIDEASALVLHDDLAYTVNDSGDSARVFAVDRATGETVGVTTYDDESPVDVEALTEGPDDLLWVGDIGDNTAERDHVVVHRIARPGPGDATVAATSYDLVYRNGPRDAEALLVHPRTGRLYVVTKGLLGGSVYAAPKQLRPDRTNVLVPVSPAPGLVTDAAFFPDGKHVVVRDYSSAHVLETTRWGGVDTFPLPPQEQGEGIAVDGDSVVVTTEGEGSRVVARPIPARVLRAMQPQPTATPAPDPQPAPAAADEETSLLDGPAVPVALGVGWLLLAVVAWKGWSSRRRRSV